MKSGIYQITNQINGKRYIGSAVNLRRRWQRHLYRLGRERHRNQRLQRAFDKYEESAFAFTILEYVEDISQLIPREQHFLDTLKPEYNIAPTAGNSLGLLLSPETRAKMRTAWTPERKQAQRDRQCGKALSLEHRQKISTAHMGQPCSAETRAKISRSQEQRYQSLYAQRNAEIVALHQQGIPKREIALRFGLSRSSISRAIKRHREKTGGRT